MTALSADAEALLFALVADDEPDEAVDARFWSDAIAELLQAGLARLDGTLSRALLFATGAGVARARAIAAEEMSYTGGAAQADTVGGVTGVHASIESRGSGPAFAAFARALRDEAERGDGLPDDRDALRALADRVEEVGERFGYAAEEPGGDR